MRYQHRIMRSISYVGNIKSCTVKIKQKYRIRRNSRYSHSFFVPYLFIFHVVFRRADNLYLRNKIRIHVNYNLKYFYLILIKMLSIIMQPYISPSMTIPDQRNLRIRQRTVWNCTDRRIIVNYFAENTFMANPGYPEFYP